MACWRMRSIAPARRYHPSCHPSGPVTPNPCPSAARRRNRSMIVRSRSRYPPPGPDSFHSLRSDAVARSRLQDRLAAILLSEPVVDISPLRCRCGCRDDRKGDEDSAAFISPTAAVVTSLQHHRPRLQPPDRLGFPTSALALRSSKTPARASFSPMTAQFGDTA